MRQLGILCRAVVGSIVLTGCGAVTVAARAPSDDGRVEGEAGDLALEAGELVPLPGRVEQGPEVPGPLVAWLRRLVAAPASEQSGMVDWERVALVREASAASLDGGGGPVQPAGGLDVRVPEGCEPGFARQEGYLMIAFPPAMTDMSEETAALVDRGVAALQEGQEILVLCSYAHGEEVEAEDGQVTVRRVVGPAPAFVLNVIPDGASWRVQAWAWLGGREDTVAP